MLTEGRTALALGAAGVAFIVGAFIASDLAPESRDSGGGAADLGVPPADDSAADFADGWHIQTAVASYQSRLLRYAESDPKFAGARFAFKHGVFMLYGAGPPSDVLRTLIDSAPPAVLVRWVRVPYSGAELRAARHILGHAMPRGSVVDFAPNYSGILVGLHPPRRSPHTLEVLYARAQRLTEIPVTFLETGFRDPM